MARYIALLRGINVGGNALVAMADLRALLAELGFTDGKSLLQSGNLVFSGEAAATAQLELLLETEVEKRLGLRADFLVRTDAEWRDIVAANPFPKEAQDDPSHLVVMALKDAPNAQVVAALQEVITGPEQVRAGRRHIYITYPDGIGRSKLTNVSIEKKLGARGTARNWNTVQKLAALL